MQSLFLADVTLISTEGGDRQGRFLEFVNRDKALFAMIVLANGRIEPVQTSHIVFNDLVVTESEESGE